ncbi:hypothetical protein [Pedobacter sp. ok626]|uniref:hypothetical protein n=1 Tax=Pedobacter sp. ok626 TaxID=1761882 RepID=UPI001050A186|nr:hypothetical protein [Pedobacter sp. ok626]
MLFLFTEVSAQDRKGNLEARLSVIQDPEDQRHLMAIGVTFINHTEKDIYLPRIDVISGSRSSYSLISFYEKKNGAYEIRKHREIVLDDNPHVMSNPIPGASNLTASLNLASVKLKRNRISEVKKMIRNSALRIDTTALFAYDNLPLFLKSGEEHTYYYTVEIHHLAKGQYKFAYEPKALENERPTLPDELVGYKKYKGKIVSQPVYIDFITIKRREHSY